MDDCEVTGALPDDPISEDHAIAAVEGAESGAIVSFRGVVRNHDEGKAENVTDQPSADVEN